MPHLLTRQTFPSLMPTPGWAFHRDPAEAAEATAEKEPDTEPGEITDHFPSRAPTRMRTLPRVPEKKSDRLLPAVVWAEAGRLFPLAAARPGERPPDPKAQLSAVPVGGLRCNKAARSPVVSSSNGRGDRDRERR